MSLSLSLEFTLGCGRVGSANYPGKSKSDQVAADIVALQAQDPPGKKGKIVRVRHKIVYRPYMRQLGIAYNNFIAINNKAPQNKEELSPYFEKAAPILKMLDKKEVVFIYGVRPDQMPSGSSNTILAYEPDSDVSGIRLVLMGDGTVQEKTEAEFAKCPKAK